MLSPQREAEIRRWSARRYLAIYAMSDSEVRAWQAVRDLLAGLDEARMHVCALPASIQEALNSGDGSYHP